MLRSLVMRHHPDGLMEAAAAGDTDVVKTMLEHLPPLPNVSHLHISCLQSNTATSVSVLALQPMLTGHKLEPAAPAVSCYFDIIHSTTTVCEVCDSVLISK